MNPDDFKVRSGTSVGANYRAACRAKSRADFVAKMQNVEEECDESLFWLELLVESGHANEGREILALVVASINTARQRNKSAICNLPSAIE